MKSSVKKAILGGIFSGLAFAGVMAFFDYMDRLEFRITRFLFYAIFFGSSQGYFIWNSLKNQKDS